MKSTIRCICLLMVVVMLVSVPALAEEAGTYSSAYFTSYAAYIYIRSGRTIEIWFDTVGKGLMDKIGVSSIQLERSLDGTNWITDATFLPEDYPQMLEENTGSACNYISYTAEYRYYYRAHVTFYGEKNNSGGYASYCTAVKYIPR